MRARTRQTFEVRQGIERNVDLARRATELVAADFLQKFVGKLAFFNKANESISWIDAGRNQVGVDLVTVLENHTLRAIVLDDDPRNRRFGANFGTKFAGGVGNGVGDGAGPTASKAPRAERAVNLAHVVVEQNVSRSRRTHAEKRADNSGSRHRGLEHIG